MFSAKYKLNVSITVCSVEFVLQMKSPVSMAGRSVLGLCLTELALAHPSSLPTSLYHCSILFFIRVLSAVQADDVRVSVNREALVRTAGIIEQDSTFIFMLRMA